MREGWIKKKLSDLGKIQTGTTPSTKNKEYYGDFIPFIKPPHFNPDGTIEYGNSGLSSQGIKKGRLIKENSILMVCIGATIGKTGITTIPVSCNQQINAFTPDKGLNPRFFYYLLNSSIFFEKVLYLSSQATLPMINKSKWQSIEVSFPKALQEQKQIVAILDKAFTAIDQAKANIEKNIVNAKELFQSKLNAIFSQKGEGWEEKSLGEVCHVQNGYAFKSKETIEVSNTQLLRMGNLYKNILDLERKPVFYPDSFSENYKEYLLKEGDLIMSLTGTVDKTDYGYTVKLPKTNVNLLLNQRIMKIEVYNTEVLNKDFLKNYLLSPDFLKRLYDTSSGTRQANLSSRTILTLKINFPSDIKKQLDIVKKLKEIRDNIVQINSDYNSKLENLEELKKSILQKTFSGELTQKEVVV
jgi:type I restriction enzyme S subunit